MNTSDTRPFGSDSSAELGQDSERVEFEAWLNPGNHPGNVSRWVYPGRYEKDTHNLAWLAWKAAKAAARQRSADICLHGRIHKARPTPEQLATVRDGDEEAMTRVYCAAAILGA